MDIRAQHVCCPRILSALTEVLGWDIRANDPRMSAGYPSQKLPLWADFSLLNCWGDLRELKGDPGQLKGILGEFKGIPGHLKGI